MPMSWKIIDILSFWSKTQYQQLITTDRSQRIKAYEHNVKLNFYFSVMLREPARLPKLIPWYHLTHAPGLSIPPYRVGVSPLLYHKLHSRFSKFIRRSIALHRNYSDPISLTPVQPMTTQVMLITVYRPPGKCAILALKKTTHRKLCY